MAPAIDPAIVRALCLDPSSATITSHGGSGFASTFRITTSNEPARSFFVKTSSRPGAATMFEGEDASLNAIHSAVPSLCPRSFGWGRMENRDETFFLATEFLDLDSHNGSGGGGGGGSSGSGLSLAQKLARLHTTPAPTPTGHSSAQFGFPVTTCCGDTPQPNDFSSCWADFFAEKRLRFILDRGESRNGPDAELHELVTRTVDTVVPRLLRPGHLGGEAGVSPVVVHGDLWSGNHASAVFAGRSDATTSGEAVVYDPSSVYGHSEYELGLVRMFGGFDRDLLPDYHVLVPKTEPACEYEDRLILYEVYHHLNHWAIFGRAGGYRAGAVELLSRLLRIK